MAAFTSCVNVSSHTEASPVLLDAWHPVIPAPVGRVNGSSYSVAQSDGADVTLTPAQVPYQPHHHIPLVLRFHLLF